MSVPTDVLVIEMVALATPVPMKKNHIGRLVEKMVTIPIATAKIRCLILEARSLRYIESGVFILLIKFLCVFAGFVKNKQIILHRDKSFSSEIRCCIISECLFKFINQEL